MEIQLILTAFIVNSGLTYGQDNDELDVKIVHNGKGQIQENFRNLLHSISKRDMKNAGTYQDILETEAALEQHAFDAVKQEIRSRQRRNARAQQTFYNKDRYIGVHAAQFKRQARAQAQAEEAVVNTVGQRYCNKLKTAISKYDAPGIVKALNDMYSHYSEVPKYSPDCKASLTRKFEDCDIEVTREIINKPYMDKVDKIQAVGVLDLRTVNSTVNLAMKAKFIINVCDLVDPLMRIMEADDFQELYPPEEKIMLFLFSYGLSRESVIDEWIAVFYQHGDIVHTDYETKCLRSEAFKEQEVTFNERPVLEYFKNVD